jgi:hypothetical protein
MSNLRRNPDPALTGDISGISPMLQATLLRQIELIATNLDNLNFLGAWSSLDTLYLQAPPRVKLDVKPMFDDVYMMLEEINQIKGVTSYHTNHLRSKARMKVIKISSRPLYGRILESFYKHRYLETYRKVTTSNLNPELAAEYGIQQG